MPFCTQTQNIVFAALSNHTPVEVKPGTMTTGCLATKPSWLIFRPSSPSSTACGGSTLYTVSFKNGSMYCSLICFRADCRVLVRGAISW